MLYYSIYRNAFHRDYACASDVGSQEKRKQAPGRVAGLNFHSNYNLKTTKNT